MYSKLPQGILPILDESQAPGQSTLELIETFLEAEATPFILRSTHKSEAEFAIYLDEVIALKQLMDFDFIIHHHAELAEDTPCLGVHLTAKSMDIAKARKLLGPQKIIGYSAHSVDEVLEAEQKGADYVILGAIFPTPKPNPAHPVLGLEKLILACKIGIPVYAIGGITAVNLSSIKQTGAAGFCSLRAVYNGDIEHNLAKLNLLWHQDAHH